MKNAIIIHGAYGHPKENWIPWIKTELETQGYTVIVPQFPTPENQNISSWMLTLEPYVSQINTETVLIGYSIGAAFLLNILERLDTKPAIAVLIAGFVNDLPDEVLNQINCTFYANEFNWEKLRGFNYVIFHSPDDPFVPLARAQELADNLARQIIIVPGAGHFNAAAGYVKFPQLLDKITHTK